MVSAKEATAVNFAPLGERVVIKPIDREETTASGIFLPDTAKEKPQEGEVIAVGSGRFSDDGKRVPHGGEGRRPDHIFQVRRHRV